MARSRNLSYNENTTMRSVFIVELHVTVKNIKTLSVAQQCAYDHLKLPATIKRTEVFM